MFPRLLIALIVVIAVFAVMRSARARLGARRPRVLGAKTVQCERCEVYLPRNEAVVRDGQHYCCEAHAQERDPKP